MNQPESQTFMPSMRPEPKVHADEWQCERERAARRLIQRLDEIADAVADAVNDQQCKDLRQFVNGKGQLAVGMQAELNDMLAEFDVPLKNQTCDEVAFAHSSAKTLKRAAS